MGGPSLTEPAVPGSVSETDNSCKVCCRDPAGRCAPYVDAEQKSLFLRKGKPCTVGFCDMSVSAPFLTAAAVTARRPCLYRRDLLLQTEGVAVPWAPAARSAGEGGSRVLTGGPHTLSTARTPSPQTGWELGGLFGKVGGF